MALAVLASVDRIRTSDYDLYGHILFGRVSLSQGNPPRLDTYSYSAPGAPWVDHEWLTEMVFAWLYDSAGPGGLILWRLLMGLAVAALLYDILRRRVRRLLPRWGLFWAALASMAAFLQFRPQMVTYLGFTFCLWVLLGPGRRDRRWLLFLPVAMVPWTNAHGGFMAGLGLVALVGAGRAVSAFRGRPGGWREVGLLGATLAGMALATLANPYGLDLHRSVLEQTTSSVTARVVVEWLPLWRQAAMGENIGVLVPFAGLFLAVALIVAASPGRLDAARWAVLGVLGLMAFKALRHVPLAAPALVAAALPAAPEAWFEEGRESPKILACLSASALILVAALVKPVSFRPRVYLTPGSFPVGAVNFMKTNGLGGNVLSQFRWGEYVLWHLGGEVKVFMDQRYDSVYPRRVIEDYLTVAFVRAEAEKVLKAYPHDFALVLPDEKLRALLEGVGARRLFADEAAALYAFSTPRTEELLANLSAAGPPGLPVGSDPPTFP
jgi:hypothetical protein